MKKFTTKIVTILSQLLVVSLFLVLLFHNNVDSKELVVNNNNLNKMADKTYLLFDATKEEQSDVVIDLSTEEEKEEEVVIEQVVEEPVVVEEVKPTVSYSDNPAIDTYTGNLTGYGPDCYGCTSGRTSTGHNLYESIYYEDSEYGTVRILAADPSIPFYSIFRISGVPGMDDFLGIVLDRGGNVGFGRGTLFDLAFTSERSPEVIGLTPNVTFELLRSGN